MDYLSWLNTKKKLLGVFCVCIWVMGSIEKMFGKKKQVRSAFGVFVCTVLYFGFLYLKWWGPLTIRTFWGWGGKDYFGGQNMFELTLDGNKHICIGKQSLFVPPNTSQAHLKPDGTKCNRVLPFSWTGVDISFNGDAFSALALRGDCSMGRMTSALGFSLGMKRASAFGVLGVSSSSLKKGTCGQQEAINLKCKFNV